MTPNILPDLVELKIKEDGIVIYHDGMIYETPQDLATHFSFNCHEGSHPNVCFAVPPTYYIDCQKMAEIIRDLTSSLTKKL